MGIEQSCEYLSHVQFSATLGIIAPQVFIACSIGYCMVFTRGLSISVFGQESVLRMSAPAVGPRVLLETVASAAPCPLRSLVIA